MLKVEYLLFIENQNIKTTSSKTFNHLLQSDPDIRIVRKKITHKNFSCDYMIKCGQVKTTGETYFHLAFTSTAENVEFFIELLKAVKAVLHVVNKSPQILYDGISLHFSNLAYPKIFEIENLMRKLITKFMLINVGIDWIKERVPDDVKSSINLSNKDLTYLHNVDFIQLKNFLFSENYTAHKENLISKLKNAKNIEELKLEEIKALIPSSNWEKYFTKNINLTKEELNKKWDQLYELRCRIAHNRVFSKSDYDTVITLYDKIQPVIVNAISNLDDIEVPEMERSVLTETVAGSFNHQYGEFLSVFEDFQKLIDNLVENKIFVPFPEERPDLTRGVFGDMVRLRNHGLLDDEYFDQMRLLITIRNKIVHSPDNAPSEDISEAIDQLKKINKILDGWL